MDIYYKVSEKGKEVKHGLILRLSSCNNNLKCVAGEDFDKNKSTILPKLNITIENSRIVSMDNNYDFYEIAESNANTLINDWVHFLNIVAEGGYNPKTPWRDM